MAIGADFPSPEAPLSLAFRILPDDRALASALADARAALRRDGQGVRSVPVPAILAEGPQASSIRAGNLEFKRFLTDAALRAKAPR